MSIFEQQLPPVAANHVPLSPVSFLRRAARVRPEHTAIVHGARRYSYQQFLQRSTRLASALQARGFGPGDCVAIMAANTPEMLEAHNAVPMLGAVLNSLNTRLDARTLAFILEHGEASAVLVDSEFAQVIGEAVALLQRPILLVDIIDSEGPGGPGIGAIDYESLLAEGSADATLPALEDEWQALSLLYTSGTTGDPKGCVYHHRGAYLNALGNLITMRLDGDSRYLWTLPMFHCDGWTFTWAVTAALGTHVCLRRVDPALIFHHMDEHVVTHLCGAPIVLNLLANAPIEQRRTSTHRIDIGTGGAAPPPAIIEAMEAMGFHVTHLYGLTETYGPATVCLPQEDWPKLDLNSRSERMARQGVAYVTQADFAVKDTDSGKDVRRDGLSLGELVLRGNTVMRGYLKNPAATDKAFADGWFHTGDLAVWHADGYVEMKDRAKDIIISGGENISTLEVEQVLFRHPAVLEAAVVGAPDAKWGETPCAFVTLREGHDCTEEDIIAWCRQHLAHFKAPRHVAFSELPKTSTGKIQKNTLRERAVAEMTRSNAGMAPDLNLKRD